MAYDQWLYERVKNSLTEKRVNFEERKMFGGICFMIDNKMCLGVNNEQLMVRLNPNIYEEVLKEPGCRSMDFTGRPMKGFVYAENEGIEDDVRLDKWIQRGLDFNPLAKASKKKRSKNESYV